MESHNVGGYLLRRPFAVRRLGHYGLNATEIDRSLDFYRNILGFRVSDELDFTQRAKDKRILEGLGTPRGYFMRYGTDHHSFVLYNKRVREALDTTGRFIPSITINQISWQVGSLGEVVAGEQWLRTRGLRMQRSGRDMPGSNWHTYFYDLDGHTNELFYGMEQVGWAGYSKPLPLYARGKTTTAVLPEIPEYAEVSEALANGTSLCAGHRDVPAREAKYDVDGVLLPRPFKIVRMGPIRLFVQDVEKAQEFYREVLGFRPRNEVSWEGHRCAVLGVGTEHHSIGLYPVALRDKLGIRTGTSTMALGMQVATYQQLLDVRAFLRAEGFAELDIPAELHPGITHAFHAVDPDGNAVELYAQMEQVLPAQAPGQRPVSASSKWPDAIEDDGTAFLGEAFLGPWE